MREFTNSQIMDAIEEVIHSKRDRNILISRYIDGLTFDELSNIYNLSDRRIKTIVYKSQDILLKYLKKKYPNMFL